MTADLLDRPPTPALPRREPRAVVPTPVRTAVDAALAQVPPIETQFEELAPFIAATDRLDGETANRFRLAVGRACRRRGLAETEFWRLFAEEESRRGLNRAAVSIKYQIPLGTLPVPADDAGPRARIAAARAELSAAEQAQMEAENRARAIHAAETAVETLRARLADARALAARLPGWLSETETAIQDFIWPSGRCDQPGSVTGLYGNLAAIKDAIQDAPQQIARLERALAEREAQLAAMTTSAN